MMRTIQNVSEEGWDDVFGGMGNSPLSSKRVLADCQILSHTFMAGSEDIQFCKNVVTVLGEVISMNQSTRISKQIRSSFN